MAELFVQESVTNLKDSSEKTTPGSRKRGLSRSAGIFYLIKSPFWSRVGAEVFTLIRILILTSIRMKLKDKNVRKITRVGGTSLAVTIPVEMARELGWKEKQRVKVKKVRGGVLIRDWKK